MANVKFDQLTARRVATLKTAGRYVDGRGLILVVDERGNRRWLLRVTVNGRRRDIGLGSCNEVSLAEAREKRDDMRREIRGGVDPLAKRARQKATPSFQDYARDLHGRIAHEWKNPKHAAQWISSLEIYAHPKFGRYLINEVDGSAIKLALARIWETKPETARRVKQRIGRVLSAAAAEGLREGANPARDISEALGKKRPAVKHHAAMPYAELPDFYSRLAESQMSPTAKAAFQFLILTAARTSEVLNAEWTEIDEKTKIWTVPATRMKAGEEHKVPLARAALAALADAKKHSDGSNLIFPGAKEGTPLSNMVFAAALKRMKDRFTAHGFRSSFRDWAEEQTSYPHAVKEAALAHKIRNKVEAAYRRTNLLERRRSLMADWAKFVSGASK